MVILVACTCFALQLSNSTKSPKTSGLQDKTWNPEIQGIGDLTETPPGAVPTEKRAPLSTVNILLTDEEFAKYIKKSVYKVLHEPGHWRPNKIVLHNTDIPSIAMRPTGFSPSDMIALDHYYGVGKGWTAGPAAFVDQNGIWIFTGFLNPGVHSPSWNSTSWGIEQLGNFDHEPYNSGDGQRIRGHTVAMLAILSIAADLPLDSETVRFHKEDIATTHIRCPGAACQKQDILDAVEKERTHWQKIWDAL
jgi:hypothetical protein